ncbi:MAG: bifunctional 5,10-methylenetetrahydrofolate dehydrogenase/5,10-methenyltetrahydrofolate cyclohydrolase [Chitinophagales bacterium]|nr:bifunctional 5,10-methylenetetrahydrofolate dehydrogenase/5,10-methenyltetrahydrofolate cyclohydrolase [Chitinophagales bacterium]
MQILNGQELSKKIKNEIKAEVDELISQGHRPPHLVAILVGDDGASQTYVNNKIRSCKECGFKSSEIRKDASLSENELIAIIEDLNKDESVDGFIIQLPLPKHIDENKILLKIKPEKDVDGFTPHSIGLMTLGLDGFKPATPFGIIKMLERYHIDTKGKHCIVIGRSNIVGKPIGIMLGQNSQVGNCTVTILNSHTKNIENYTREADILIVAIGKPKMVTADMVKEGAVVIDVGITRVADDSEKGFHLEGDVDYDSVAPKCSYITPVPGGVGPMTVTMLLFNTLQARKKTLTQTS